MPDRRHRVRGAVFAALGGALGAGVAYSMGDGTSMFYPGLAVLAAAGAAAGVWLNSFFP